MANGIGKNNPNPSSPIMAAGKFKTPHDMNHTDNVYGGNGTDIRGGGAKGKTVPGLVHSIPNHYYTQNGKDEPNKRAKVIGGGK